MRNYALKNEPGAITYRSTATKLFVIFAVFACISGCRFIDDLEDVLDDKKDKAKKPALELVAEGLTAPVMVTEVPDGSGRLLVVDQIGLIRVVMPDGTLREEPFLDIRDKIIALNEHYDERGLLGLALHPDHRSNGKLYVYYSAPLRAEAPDDWNHTNYVSEFTASAAPLMADPNSEKTLLHFDFPYSNHNAGTLAFGPMDGYLYISVGDGGNRDDEGMGHVDDWYEDNAGGNGQDITENLLGNILRIDVDGGDPYGIPADNPFVDKEGLDEIYAYGFRNPYRFSFDMEGSHQLFAGDAGQELWEEVSIVRKGGNYGWNVKEGSHCFDAENPEHVPADCPDNDPEGDPLIDPVIEFKNSKQPGGLGLVVVAGYVYRGDELPKWNGQYIFGTWSATHEAPNGLVFIAKPKGSAGLWDFHQIEFANTPTGDLNSYLLGFGQNSKGEVYILTSDTEGPSGHSGKVYMMVEKDK